MAQQSLSGAYQLILLFPSSHLVSCFELFFQTSTQLQLQLLLIMSFDPVKDIPDLSDKVFLVTGGKSSFSFPSKSP